MINNMFYENGVLVETLGPEAYQKYSSSITCPYCNSVLRVFKTAWKPLRTCNDKGYFTDDSKYITIGTQCPICGEYFTPNGEKINDNVLGDMRYVL